MSHETFPYTPEAVSGSDNVTVYKIAEMIDHVSGFERNSSQTARIEEQMANVAIVAFRGDPKRVQGHPAFEE
jgi:hypothetical protein